MFLGARYPLPGMGAPKGQVVGVAELGDDELFELGRDGVLQQVRLDVGLVKV